MTKETTAPPTATNTNTFAIFSSLRYPKFRLLWANVIASQISWYIQNVLVSFAVLQRTNSFLLLGITMALNFAPNLFGLVSGVIADRFSRRKVIALVNVSQITLTILLAFVVSGKQLSFEAIAIIVFLSSTIRALMQPSQYALTADIVEAKDISNAISFTSLSQYFSGIIGPTIVGFFANVIGIQKLFFLSAGLTSVGLVALIIMGEVSNAGRNLSPKSLSILSNIREGFRYSWAAKGIFGAQMVYLVTNIYVWPAFWTLMPIYSTSVLAVGASRFGWLYTVNNIGGLVGNLFLASRASLGKGKLLSITCFATVFAIVFFATFAWYPAALAGMLMWGLFGSMTMTSATIILLVNASPEVRGRVMGLQTVYISSQAGGSLVAALLAQSLGAAAGLYAEGIGFTLTMIALLATVPALRKS